MIALAWNDASIGRHHDRKSFDCGDRDLNAHLQRYARQNHDIGGAKTFIAATTETPERVLGYYTLSPTSLDYARTPETARRGLGRYDVPMFRGRRLAVDLSVQGRGLGGQLLLRAAHRCIAVRQEVGGVALLIDAKNDRAALWYESYGSVRLDDAPLSLVLPLSVFVR